MDGKECLKTMFDKYVKCASINKPGAQREADIAYRWLDSHLTSREKEDLEQARRQVLEDGKPEALFKEACDKIHQRIF
jgi:hypothetical protein